VQGTTLLCRRPYTHIIYMYVGTRRAHYYSHTHTHTHTKAHSHSNTHVHYIIIMYACTKVITRFSLLPNSPDTIILRFVFHISVCQHASCVRQYTAARRSLRIPRVLWEARNIIYLCMYDNTYLRSQICYNDFSEASLSAVRDIS